MAVSSKKSTKKPAKRPAAKKATVKKKEVVKSVSASKSVKSAKKAPLTPLERLRSLNVLSGGLYLVLAAAAAYFLSPITTKLTMGLQARDQFAGEANALGPATEVLATVELRYLLAAVLAFAGVASLLLAYRFRTNYEKSLADNASGIRWLVNGVIVALSVEFVALLAGITDLVTLKLIAGLIILSALLALIAERQNKGAKPNWLAYILGVFAGVLAWLPIIGVFVGTWLYGSESYDWYVYAAAGVLAISSILVARRQYKWIKSNGNYLQNEEGYLKTELFTKLALVIVLLSALYK